MNRDLSKHTTFLFLLLLATLVLSGCAVGPNYKRPTVSVPVTYRGTTAETAAATERNTSEAEQAASANGAAESLGDEKRWEIFQDKELQGLIRMGLSNKYDVRIASTRVLGSHA